VARFAVAYVVPHVDWLAVLLLGLGTSSDLGLQLSAIVGVVSCSFVGKSAMYRSNRVGPNALPGGTPVLIM